MQILLIGDRLSSRQRIMNYSGMWSWYLSQALERNGHEVRFGRRYRPGEDPDSYVGEILADGPGADAIVSLGVSYLERLPPDVLMAMEYVFPGPLAQIQDNPGNGDKPLHVDFALSVRDGPHSIGWAADPELYYPEQQGRPIRLFFDHCNHGLSGWDYSHTLMRNLDRLDLPYEAVTLTDAGIVPANANLISIYRRATVPVERLAAALRQTDIFVVTHPESVGLTALEAAMCGAMVLLPDGCLQQDRLATIDHMIVPPCIPWARVIGELDAQRSHERASLQTWDRVARRMVKHLATWSP